MKRFIVLACLAAAISLTTGTAFADSIQGRFGVTGRIGFLIPNDSDYGNLKLETDAGFVGGGGVIFGIDKNFAAEIDVSRTEFGSNKVDGTNTGDFGITNVSLGAQYRFTIEQPKLVPFVGAGLDILITDFDPSTNLSLLKHDVDTTVGVHLSGGIDYFIMKQLALTAEVKALLAPETDIKDPSGAQGNFNPSSVSTTFGVRFFFN
jgi:outer membrane protein